MVGRKTTLVDLLKELNLQTSRAVFDLQPNGEMLLDAHIQGYNPQNPTHHPITLNYRHRENMFELWDMIDYGQWFEQIYSIDFIALRKNDDFFVMKWPAALLAVACTPTIQLIRQKQGITIRMPLWIIIVWKWMNKPKGGGRR